MVMEPQGWLDRSGWGRRVHSSGWRMTERGTLEVHEPAAGARFAVMGAAAPGDVGTVVVRASRAQNAWARAGPQQRAQVLYEARRLLSARSAEVCERPPSRFG